MTGFPLSVLARSARVPFLVLGPVCAFLGIGTAVRSGIDPRPLHVVLAMIGAVAAHISVNAFNEYADFRSGLDSRTVKTPFSGGSGALVDFPQAAESVRNLAVACLVVTLLVGAYFVLLRGVLILPAGLAGILLILTYTQVLTHNPWLCLLAPGTGFGPLMVSGTHFVLTGSYSGSALFISLVPFFLTNNLLLLNQLPDREADRTVGRRHFPIAFGAAATGYLHGLFTLATALVILYGLRAGMLPVTASLSLIPLAASLLASAGVLRGQEAGSKLLPVLGLNVLASVITPLILGVTLIDG